MGYGYGLGYGYSYGLADAAALLVPVDQTIPLQGLSTNAGSTPPLPLGARGLVELDVPISGTLSVEQPTSPNSETLNGAQGASFYGDFYERIYATPADINFGVVALNKTKTIGIWNAYLADATLDSFSVTDLDEQGISDTAPALPYTLSPLGTRDIDLTASAFGTGDILGSVTLTFTPEDIATVEVEGIRGRLWPFTPNWSNPYTLSYEYKTEILSSRDGTEQRRALRRVPRKTVEFTAHLTGDDRREANRRLDGVQNIEHVTADYTRFMVAAEEVPGTASEVSVGTTPDWVEDGLLLVIAAGRKTELRQVESFTASTITFATGGETWPAGTKIYFGLVGYLDDNFGSRRLTNDVIEARFRLETSPGREVYVAPPDPPLTFNGYEVFEERPNWASPLDVSYERETEIVDFGMGLTKRYFPTPFGSRVTTYRFTRKSLSDSFKVIDVFRRMRGRCGAFYMPTWENDLELAETATQGTSLLQIKGEETARDYASNDVFKTVMIQLKDGTRLYRHTSTVYTVSNGSGGLDTMLQLTESIPQEISAQNVDMICWVPVCRFASDSLTVVWRTDSVAEIRVNVKTLPYEVAENI